jgi:hypothetical protein
VYGDFSATLYKNDLGQEVKGIWQGLFGNLAKLADGKDVVHGKSWWQIKAGKA